MDCSPLEFAGRGLLFWIWGNFTFFIGCLWTGLMLSRRHVTQLQKSAARIARGANDRSRYHQAG